MKKSLNIKEDIAISEEYSTLSKQLCELILTKGVEPIGKVVIAVGGESGSGKTTTAVCLEEAFADKGIVSTTIHMDSYFKLPPKENHQKRIVDFSNVGPQEINMNLMNDHIASFKANVDNITIPVLNYKLNQFTEEKLDLSNVSVLIVEGVYSFLLDGLDHRVFMSRSYKDTYQNRIKRTRENYDPRVELILDIEHKIVSPLIENSDFIINKDYEVVQNKTL